SSFPSRSICYDRGQFQCAHRPGKRGLASWPANMRMNPGTEANPGPEQGTTRRSRWPIVIGFGLSLAALACAILVSLLHLRQKIFTQIANRDGERLAEVAAVQFAEDKAN